MAMIKLTTQSCASARQHALINASRSASRCMASFPKLKNIIPDDTPELKDWKERESRVVKEQLTRSKLSDARAAASEKLFVAPPDIVAALPSNAFPPTPMTVLSDGSACDAASAFARAPASIVTVAFQGHGQAQLQPWLEHALTSLAPEPAFAPGGASHRPHALQHVNLLFLQGWFFSIFAPVLVRSIRRTTQPPALLHAGALAFRPSARDTDHWADKLRVVNRMQAHVFLVDRAGIVRWQAHGRPAAGELQALEAAAATLVAAGTGGARPPPGAFQVR